ncbi:hypothetical protein BJ138DRAFT_503853 [Hygrophoropsis aurantiaca]|uniref:Uncharacterized protein n=1 Tax=Hygrophoropsis aurantiaca TaxID=72124 RepID=A0ACB8ALG3_9AGAM|nr:hypothetical protein BJ138DRAFT_503853 [Hygrophoropsis aurantiaca]
MDGNLAATYTLVYTFLKNRSHTKAADALKKAAKDVVILKDDIDSSSPPLNDIIEEWKAFKNPKMTTSDSSSSSDDSSDDSDSSGSSEDESDSGESSSHDETPKVAKPILSKVVPIERDTSVTLSSGMDNIVNIGI